MNEKNRAIKDLIRFARKSRQLAQFSCSKSIGNHLMCYEMDQLHIAGGRKLFPEAMIEKPARCGEYAESAVRINIDGKPFRFYWLTKLD